MIALTLAEVAAAVSGRLAGADPAAVVTGTVEFDSRKVTAGGLFVAFPGEKADGHDFAAAAVAAGAVAVVGTREVDGVPTVVVDDPLTAMAALARAVLDRLPGVTVIGLTGSSGKTTTKDLIAQLAARLGPTVAPAGSFNNELGHPYTVLQADEKTRFLVLEMGARGPGHLRHLAGIAPPRIGVVLNVGVAHIGEFGSVEAIAAAKGELAEAVAADGLVVLNADDPAVRAMATRTRARVTLVGEADDAAVRAVDVTVDPRGRASYTLVVRNGRARVTLAVPGRHQVGNSLAAAALRALAAMGEGRRTIAVLGYLAELGDHERSGHEEVGRLAAQLGVDRLLVVGDNAGPIHDGAVAVDGWAGDSRRYADQAAAIDALRPDLRTGDVVLVKGSRYRTWEIADALRDGVGTA